MKQRPTGQIILLAGSRGTDCQAESSFRNLWNRKASLCNCSIQESMLPWYIEREQRCCSLFHQHAGTLSAKLLDSWCQLELPFVSTRLMRPSLLPSKSVVVFLSPYIYIHTEYSKRQVPTIDTPLQSYAAIIHAEKLETWRQIKTSKVNLMVQAQDHRFNFKEHGPVILLGRKTKFASYRLDVDLCDESERNFASFSKRDRAIRQSESDMKRKPGRLFFLGTVETEFCYFCAGTLAIGTTYWYV